MDLFGVASTGVCSLKQSYYYAAMDSKSKQNSTLAARMMYRQQDKQAREFLSPGKQISISPVHDDYLGRQQMKVPGITDYFNSTGFSFCLIFLT